MTKEPRQGERLSKPENRLPACGRILVIGRSTEIHLVVLDLRKLVARMQGDLRCLLRKDIRLDVSLLAPGRCLVSADRHQMRELVLHLILDARDAMPEGGSLSITVDKRRVDEAGSFHPAKSADYVMVAVRDSPARQAPGIVEPVKGRGLSLAASYDAIRRCGGHLIVSRPVKRW